MFTLEQHQLALDLLTADTINSAIGTTHVDSQCTTTGIPVTVCGSVVKSVHHETP